MKMKVLSAQTGISDRTIRYYIDDGLFIPERYTENYEGRRSYDFTESDVKRLKQIALLRKYGFSINEIKEFKNGNDSIVGSIDKRIAEVKQYTEEQLDEVKVLEAISEKPPQNIDEMCEMLSNPVVEQAPIPTIDEQNGHKLMLSRWKKESLVCFVLMTAFIVLIFLLGFGLQKSFVYFKATIIPESIPENTEFIDLLINIPLNKYVYTDNTEIDLHTLDDQIISFSKESEIYNYDEQDYRSYSLHYKRALPVTHIKRDFGKQEYVIFYDSEFLSLSPAVKIAYVSKDGSIITTTNLSTANNISYIMDCEGVIADGNHLKPERSVNLRFVLIVQLFAGFISVAIGYWTKRNKFYQEK